MIYLTEDEWLDQRDRFREDVLHAMDKAMTKIYAEETKQGGLGLAVDKFGARDEDLPVLFKALDVQFTNNMDYLGFEQKDDDQ